jgi:hypothetical protein
MHRGQAAWSVLLVFGLTGCAGLMLGLLLAVACAGLGG